jgi:hypothetical protein
MTHEAASTRGAVLAAILLIVPSCAAHSNSETEMIREIVPALASEQQAPAE